MTTMEHDPGASAKRPYVTPVLAGYDLFGAEATSSQCCRATTGTCSTSVRGTLRIRIDGAKKQTSVNS